MDKFIKEQFLSELYDNILYAISAGVGRTANADVSYAKEQTLKSWKSSLSDKDYKYIHDSILPITYKSSMKSIFIKAKEVPLDAFKPEFITKELSNFK